MDNETFNPATLRKRPALELFQMRKRILGELQSQAFVVEQRQPSPDEKAYEERAENNLGAIDKALEEVLRTQQQDAAMSRYSGFALSSLASVTWRPWIGSRARLPRRTLSRS